LNDSKIKKQIFTNLKNVNNPSYNIMNDLPYHVRKKNALFLKARYEARKAGKVANIVRGELFINDTKQVIVNNVVRDEGTIDMEIQ
jgi:hypothetical protein